MGAVVTSMPPVDLNIEGQFVLSTSRRASLTFAHYIADERLATKAGEDRHQQQQVDVAEERRHRFERCVGIGGESDAKAERTGLVD